jgi:hypothetical protein
MTLIFSNMKPAFNLFKTAYLLLCICCFLCLSFFVKAQTSSNLSRSEWVYLNADGKLTYKTLNGGDRIMDYSHAGYMGGGIKIPTPDVKITVGPSEGDHTKVIQQAIDEVAKMKLVNGFRGAVLLKPGTYNCNESIVINASGVVLRGSGSGKDGTVINMTGKAHPCIIVSGKVISKIIGKPMAFSDAYTPSGTYSFGLADVSALKAGDTIRIGRPVTAAWVKLMGMDTLVRDGKKQTWIAGEITTDRVIRKIEDKRVTVDIPLTDSYDSKYLGMPGTTAVKISSSGELSQVGIENLRMVSPDQTGTINESHHKAFSMSGIADGWARNISVFNTVNSVSVTGKRITVDNLSIMHSLATVGAAKPADINGSGQQLLFNRCTITGDNMFFFGTGAKVTGPVVLLNCVFKGNGWIQPHQRWATGLLIDGCQVPDGGIDFMNRGSMGSGHGWAIGWAVAWNSKAKSFLNQHPPGAANWVIGGQGEKQKKVQPFNNGAFVAEGIYDAYGTPVTPGSLYLAQLAERLGAAAVANIGY